MPNDRSFLRSATQLQPPGDGRSRQAIFSRPLGLALLLACATAAQGDTLRCGSQLVSVGDRSFEVEQKCGDPVFRDLIGYTLGPYQRQELKIEEWIYGPSNGMLTILTFEGNRLTRIERRRGP